MLKRLRPILSVVLLAMALAIGVYYLASHRNLLRQLAHTHLEVIFIVLVLYVAMFGVLLLILNASIKICHGRLSKSENVKLNAHSLLINFFVPGQGGPVYRGYYLHKHQQLKVKNYVIVVLMYYACYALISVFMLLVGSLHWWQTVLALLGVALLGVIAIRKYSDRAKIRKKTLDLSAVNISYLFLATILQAIVQLIIYTTELHSVNSHISISQIITYTGAANLALFVSLTPGAIGIREAFLLFTNHLHHISSANVILANVIDRSVYLVFLLTLIIFIVGQNVRKKVRLSKTPIPIK